MTLKATLRQLLLLPIQPRMLLWETRVLRLLRLLPERSQGEWPPQRILVVNVTGNLGDALMMLPLVDSLHRTLPTAEIDVVAESPMDLPLRAVRAIRRVYCFRSAKTKIPLVGHYLRVVSMVIFARRWLIGEHYDLALLPRWGTDPGLSTYLASMSSAPRRCGHDPQEEVAAEEVFPGMTALLTTVSHGGEGLAEGVREQLVLLACGLLGGIDQEREERRPVESVIQMGSSIDIAACMRRLGVAADTRLVLLSPGASHPARRWPPEWFALLGEALSSRTGAAIYSIGGIGDRALGRHIEALSGGLIRSLAGETSVLEGIALIQTASLLVTNDSGPAHIGGSVGTPTLVLSACPKTSTHEHANSPRRVRPVGPKVHVMQPPESANGCSGRCLESVAHCILGLTVESALCHAEQLLELQRCETSSSGAYEWSG